MTDNHIPVIVYGPPACGKTRNAETLRKMLSCSAIIDNWEPGDPMMNGALHLSITDPSHIPMHWQRCCILSYENLVYGEDFL